MLATGGEGLGAQDVIRTTSRERGISYARAALPRVSVIVAAELETDQSMVAGVRLRSGRLAPRQQQLLLGTPRLVGDRGAKTVAAAGHVLGGWGARPGRNLRWQHTRRRPATEGRAGGRGEGGRGTGEARRGRESDKPGTSPRWPFWTHLDSNAGRR